MRKMTLAALVGALFAATAALVLTKRFSPLWGLLLGAVAGAVFP